MKTALSTQDQRLLGILGRVRAMLPERAQSYPGFGGVTMDAMRKRMERLCQNGLLSKSTLPSGRPLFRLSAKGVKVTDAPEAWAKSPTTGTMAEALSVSAMAWKLEYTFLTTNEVQTLLRDMEVNSSKEGITARTTGRIVLRDAQGPDGCAETRLNVWLAEFKPADELARRVHVVRENLSELPILGELIGLGLFGITVAVPSEGVRATLLAKTLPPQTDVVVVDELKHLSRI